MNEEGFKVGTGSSHTASSTGVHIRMETSEAALRDLGYGHHVAAGLGQHGSPDDQVNRFRDEFDRGIAHGDLHAARMHTARGLERTVGPWNTPQVTIIVRRAATAWLIPQVVIQGVAIGPQEDARIFITWLTTADKRSGGVGPGTSHVVVLFARHNFSDQHRV